MGLGEENMQLHVHTMVYVRQVRVVSDMKGMCVWP